MPLADLWRTYCRFANEHVWLCNGAFVLLLAGLLFLYQHRGVAQRRRRFRTRPSLTEEEWFTTFYPASQPERERVREVLQAFGDDIGIEWARLRPTDTFEKVLRVDKRYSPYDDLEEAELEIASLAEKLGVADKEMPGFTGVLQDFLDRWVILCGGQPPGTRET